MKPAAFTSSKVDDTTGGLFHEPSSGVASSVFPRFHPGLRLATKSAAEMGVNVPAHVVEGAEEVEDAEADEVVVVVVAVAGTHW